MHLFFFIGLVALLLVAFTFGEQAGRDSPKRAELEKKVLDAKKSLDTAKVELATGPYSYVTWVVVVIVIASFATVGLRRCEDAVQYERRGYY